MEQKNTNSKRYEENKTKEEEKKKSKGKNLTNKDDSDFGSDNDSEGQQKDEDENLEDFMSDEEHENFDSQKEDMKAYLSNLNKRIDTLVDALKQAD